MVKGEVDAISVVSGVLPEQSAYSQPTRRGRSRRVRALVGFPGPPPCATTLHQARVDDKELVHRHCHSTEGSEHPSTTTEGEAVVRPLGGRDAEGAREACEAPQSSANGEATPLPAPESCSYTGANASFGLEVRGCFTDVTQRLHNCGSIGDGAASDFPGQEYSQKVTATLAVHPDPCGTPAFPCEADQRGSEEQCAFGHDNLQRVPSLAEEVLEGPTSDNLQHTAQRVRGAEEASEVRQGVHDGVPSSERRLPTLVPRSSTPGRGSGADGRLLLAPPDFTLAARYLEPEQIVAKCISGYTLGPDVHTSEGRLDAVPPDLPGRVDLSDRSLHPEYPRTSPIGIAQRVLFSDSLVDFLKPDRQAPQYRSSQNAQRRHVDELLNFRLCHTKTRKERERGFARFFTVLKKVDEDGVPILRTILDCVTANKVFVDPLPVNLLNLHTLISSFSEVECMRAMDLRHWFHQLRTGTYLKSFFTIAFGSLRLVWDEAPMGFKWVPFIAQAITTMFVVGPEVASSWMELPRLIEIGDVRVAVIYDNIIAGGPESQVDEVWATIHRRLIHYRVLVKEGSDIKAVGGSSLDALGLRWLPASSGLRWSLLPKFVDKVGAVLRLAEQSVCRTKEIASVIGLLAWGRYATRQDLFDLQQAYALLTADVAMHGWRGTTTPQKYSDVFEKLSALQGYGWQQHLPAASEVLAFTDAHNLCGHGHVGGAPLVCRSRRWPVGSAYLPKDMYYLEAIGLKHTVMSFARPGRRLFVGSDNLSLVCAVRNRSTACPRTARVLHEMFEYLRSMSTELIVGWISTVHNPADELSRHLPLDREKLYGAERQTHWTVPPSPEFGPRLGRVVGSRR